MNIFEIVSIVSFAIICIGAVGLFTYLIVMMWIDFIKTKQKSSAMLGTLLFLTLMLAFLASTMMAIITTLPK